MDIEVEIERYADQGRCIAHVDGRVVFVRFALPGERVRVKVDEPHNRTDRLWTGEVTEVLEASPDRVTPPWPLAGPLSDGGGVGGADLIHVSLPGQLKWKKFVINDQMKRLGHVTTDVEVMRASGDEDGGGLHWRTRIEMVADDEGHPSMRRRESHDRVPIDDMPLATETLLAVAHEEDVWNTRYESGVQIRLAAPEPRTGTVKPLNPEATADAHRMDGASPNYAVMVDGKQVAGRRLLTEDVDVTLPGRKNPTRLSYTVDCGGFWQVHRDAPAVLTQTVLDFAIRALEDTVGRGMGSDDGSTVIWDLFSGSGLFTLPLAVAFGHKTRVLSVEGNRNAVTNARRNLDRYGASNAETRMGDVGRVLRSIPKKLAHPDLVVLDPPRAGAKAAVCQAIADAGASTVIYVACDPTSLARDVATFAKLGYGLSDIRAYDIYPMTHHVETVVLMSRVKD